MDRRQQRLTGSARVLRHRDDGAFDRAFWRGILPAQRLELMWEMVVEWLWPTRTTTQYGEQRIWIIGRDDLIADKRAAGRPQDLLDLATLEKHITD
jgi:hypothetical protein